MRFSKLYFKIFLAFIATIIAAEIVVYGMILRGGPPPPFIRNVVKDATMAGKLIQKELGNSLPSPSAASRTLKPLMRLLTREHMQVWVTDGRGVVFGTSFDGPAPVMDQDMTPISLPPEEPVRMFTTDGEQFKGIYVEAPVRLDNGSSLTVHMRMERRPHKEEEWFLKGLILLTVLSALFILPVTRGIIRPIRNLSEAADRLGHGDFSQRVPVKGGDEVAVLADKFNRMAKRLERMVMSGKELTAHLSHELRTPLARMRISLQMIMERPDDADNARRLAKIEDEIDNMDATIGHILDLSKLDLQEPPPRKDHVDVAEKLRLLLETYGPMAEQHHLRLETTLAPVPDLTCNAHGLEVILNNVLSNAMKYAEPDGCITVTTSEIDGAVRIEVCNTHPPLNEKDMEDMFTPFHRLHRNSEAGTGLGLASARKIAELHGGSIRAAYQGGRVCLRIVLPLG